ncbi:BnaC01g00020D [Brassica napus]|uniref:BnaC01g00020D protein n=1 Tax=Brassica napus TaxID=3708 RepID=A0A078HVV9_BRANA|nr:BnaC01g00020D [Brassica napus]
MAFSVEISFAGYPKPMLYQTLP